MVDPAEPRDPRSASSAGELERTAKLSRVPGQPETSRQGNGEGAAVTPEGKAEGSAGSADREGYGRGERSRTAGLESAGGKTTENKLVRSAKSGNAKSGAQSSPSRSLWRRLPRQGLDAWNAVLERPWPWLLLALFVGTWVLSPGGILFAPRVDSGSIATRDYVATEALELLDESATETKRLQAGETIRPLYDLDPRVGEKLEEDLGKLFAAGRELAAEEAAGEESSSSSSGAADAADAEVAPDPADILARASGLSVSATTAELLTAQGFSADLEDRVRGIVHDAVARQVVANKARLLDNPLRGFTVRNLASQAEWADYNPYDRLGYPDEVQEFLESQARGWPGLTAAERREMVTLVFSNLAPNLNRNLTETERRRDEAMGAVEPLFTRVRKGQVIVRKGDEVGPAAAEAIAQLTGKRPLAERVLPVLGTFALLALSLVVLRLGLRGERVQDHSRDRVFNEAALLLLLSLLGAKFGFTVASALSAAFERVPLTSAESYIATIPFGALALLVSLALGRQSAVVLSVLFSLLMSRLTPGDPVAVVIYCFAGSLAAIYGLEHYQLKQRLVLTRIGLLVGLVNVVATLLLLALSGAADRGPAQIAFDVVCSFAGGLFVAAVVGFMVPILESTLSITTDIKLVELANTNLPLLRRLAFEAPGTFQHSLMVANLAKVGCEAVGGDATLAYTGGLYHDIGKVLRPEYFVENQRPGNNRHDKLVPSMSALILINHVKEGVEIAREHHLPKVIIDAIEQHHGTRLIKFFYNRALQQCERDSGTVQESKYRYPGPQPQDKVMGVLMLADAVEAASRTLTDPTPAKVRAMIRTLIDDCLADGQLDHTDLTLADLRRVAEAFQLVLTNIFHRRIDYPGFDFNSPKRERRSVTEAARAS